MPTLRVIYSGRVQGVGFRFRVRMLSERHAVTGTVKNQPDGSVELIAQGDSAEVERFREAIRREMRGLIREENAAPVEGAVTFPGFDITY